MTEMILLSETQMARISPFFPLSHGIPRVDDRRVISGIIFVIRNGLRWRDVPPSYGPHKTIYNRFIRWSELGVFGRIFLGSGLIDHIQKMTIAAIAMADMKVCAQRS
jgi:putative transposase